MEKRDKVIAGLECCGTDAIPERCKGCPYERSVDLSCVDNLMVDALALLKTLDQTRMDLEVTRMNLGATREELNRLEGSYSGGDLISRSALLAEIEENPWAIDIDELKAILEHVPVAEAEPVVHAHWVKLTPDQRDYFTDYTHCCSRCGEWGKKNYKRCRECGAVMDEKVFEPTPIGKVMFSLRVYKRLKQAGITTMEQLQSTDKKTLYSITGLGKQSILEIEEKLQEWNEEVADG